MCRVIVPAWWFLTITRHLVVNVYNEDTKEAAAGSIRRISIAALPSSDVNVPTS